MRKPDCCMCKNKGPGQKPEDRFSHDTAHFSTPSLNYYAIKYVYTKFFHSKFEPRHEKTIFCICENKDPDQPCGNCEADHCLCFRFTASTIPLLPK